MSCIFPQCEAAGRIRRAVCDRFCNHPEVGNGRTVSPAICNACPLAGKPIPPQRPKVGDVLSRMIFDRYGRSVTAGCDCTSRIADMNAWGPDGCAQNIDTIVDWLIEAAAAVGDVRAMLPAWAQRWKLRGLVRKAVKAVREWAPAG